MQISQLKLLRIIRHLQRDDGISAIEYAMIAAAIALVVMGAAPDIANVVTSHFGTAEGDIWPAP